MSVFILRSWKICAEVGTCHCCNGVCWRVIHARKLANYVTKLAKKYNISSKIQENIASFVNRWRLLFWLHEYRSAPVHGTVISRNVPKMGYQPCYVISVISQIRRFGRKNHPHSEYPYKEVPENKTRCSVSHAQSESHASRWKATVTCRNVSSETNQNTVPQLSAPPTIRGCQHTSGQECEDKDKPW